MNNDRGGGGDIRYSLYGGNGAAGGKSHWREESHCMGGRNWKVSIREGKTMQGYTNSKAPLKWTAAGRDVKGGRAGQVGEVRHSGDSPKQNHGGGNHCWGDTRGGDGWGEIILTRLGGRQAEGGEIRARPDSDKGLALHYQSIHRSGSLGLCLSSK